MRSGTEVATACVSFFYTNREHGRANACEVCQGARTMSKTPTRVTGDTIGDIRYAVETSIPGARCVVAGGNGHYTMEVASLVFVGLSKAESHNLVMSAINHLMTGDRPAVVGVDSLRTHAK